jgi:hypothetical protein
MGLPLMRVACGCAGNPSDMELFRAFEVFREDAENGTQDGRAPHFNFGRGHVANGLLAGGWLMS